MSEKTIWAALDIPKDDFNWVKDFMKEEIDQKSTQSEVVINLIKQLRHILFNEDLKTEISQYEVRIFLLGKILEKMINDGTINKLMGNSDDIIDKIKRDLGLEE